MSISSIAFVSCSNGLSKSIAPQIQALTIFCERQGFHVLQSPYLYAPDNLPAFSAQQRASTLMSFFNNPSVKYIFDLSGGDMANEVIPFLDFNQIHHSSAVFCGYSDLTVLINAIFCKASKPSVLYQPRHLLQNESIQANFFENLSAQSGKLFNFEDTFLCGSSLSGTVIGGNVRCFLKLAGTPFFPSPKNKILFLESCGGTIPQLSTYFAQLFQLNFFNEINGILLGTFTEFEKTHPDKSVYSLLKPYLPSNLPIAQTSQIGHAPSSLALTIGTHLELMA